MRLSRFLFDGLFVLISEFNNLFIAKSSYKVGLNYSLENRETMLNIPSVVKSVYEDSCDFNFISRPSRID